MLEPGFEAKVGYRPKQATVDRAADSFRQYGGSFAEGTSL
jgi:hypothetical protein